VIPCIREHISSLRVFFQKYIPDNSGQCDWVRDPFSATAPADFSSAEKEQFISMTKYDSDSASAIKE